MRPVKAYRSRPISHAGRWRGRWAASVRLLPPRLQPRSGAGTRALREEGEAPRVRRPLQGAHGLAPRAGERVHWPRRPFHPLQQALKDLDRAYRNFLDGLANLPRFKKKGRHDAFRYPVPKQFAVDDSHGRMEAAGKWAGCPTARAVR